MIIEAITRENLSDYKHLILTYIWEELNHYPTDLDEDFICLAAHIQNPDGIFFPVSAVICQMEPIGDLNVLSIYTLPEHRRQGYASALLAKVLYIARRLYQFEEDVTEENIFLKSTYRLSPEREAVYDSFLKKNHFTDFVLLDEKDDPQVWAAMAEYRFYKTDSD